MVFASQLYAGVTSKFFDYLVDNINGQFEGRCQQITKQNLYANEINFEEIQREPSLGPNPDDDLRREIQTENMAWAYQ